MTHTDSPTRASSSRACRLIVTLLCTALQACGGGEGMEAPEAATGGGRASDRTAALAITGGRSIPGLQHPIALSRPIRLSQLATADPAADAGLRAVQATAQCREGFVAPADLTHGKPAPLPASGGVYFSARERAIWRERMARGPFLVDSDFALGSPGDWARIHANAGRFQHEGEPLSGTDDASRSRHGGLARDAAFHHLLTGNAASLVAVRQWLLAMASAPANDFAGTRCYTAMDGSSRDGWWAEAPWLARFVATYDFVRAALPAAERVTIENYIRRNAWFFAAHLDWQLRELFPQRLSGNYTVRGADAASSGDARWASRRVDSNGDCRIDDADAAQAVPVHAYARADGSLGPRVSVLTLWFNNRRAANAFAAGSAGLLLGDAALVNRAKRYFMEWMTYAVYADGSTGEFGRNGEYCIARQGLVYAAMDLGGALMLARALARQGDTTLASFRTVGGLHGSESGSGTGSTGVSGPAKSLALLADTYLKISTGELDWYQAEPQKARQEPREATRLSRMEVRYLGGAPMDDFHELTLLASAAVVPGVPVGTVLMRQGAAASLRWPGRTGHPVATGLGHWSDAWGILPAAYLLRP